MKKKIKNPTLYIVVPCYNEEETLYLSSKVFLDKINELKNKNTISEKSKILFVNDGSKDNTEDILVELTKQDNFFAMVSFLANAGHQNAIYAGMMVAKDYADIVITIDADLQQDINAIEKFIEAYKNGNDVVYGIRNNRKTDGFIKKITAGIYYKTMRFMGCNLLENSADYRLLSKKALEALSSYKENDLFLRGLIPTLGLKSDIVYFDVKEREAGESKYTFKKMFNLAIAGVTSFGSVPIHLICALGFILFIIGIIIFLCNLVGLLFNGVFTNIEKVSVLLFSLSGIIVVCIGAVGEYVGTINSQVKQRPRYIIDYVINNNKKENNDK